MAKLCSFLPSACLSLRIAGYGVVLFTLMSAAMHIFCGFMLIKSPLSDYFYYQNLALNAPMASLSSSSSNHRISSSSNGTHDEFGANILYQHIVLTQRLIASGDNSNSGSNVGGRHGIWHYLLPLSGHVDDQLVSSISSGSSSSTAKAEKSNKTSAAKATSSSPSQVPTSSTTDSNIAPILSRAFFYYYSIAGCFIAVGLLTIAAADCLIVGLVGRTAAPLSLWTVLYAFNIALRTLFVAYLAWRAYMFYNYEINYVEKIDYLTSAYSSPAPPPPRPTQAAAARLMPTTIKWLAHPSAPTTLSSSVLQRGKRENLSHNISSKILSQNLSNFSSAFFQRYPTASAPQYTNDLDHQVHATSSSLPQARVRRYTPPIIEPALRRMRTEIIDPDTNFIRYRVYSHDEEVEEQNRRQAEFDRGREDEDKETSSVTIIPYVFQPEQTPSPPSFFLPTTPSAETTESFKDSDDEDEVYPFVTRSTTTGTLLAHNTALLRRGNNILDSPFLFIFVILILSFMFVDIWCLFIVLRLRQTVAVGSEYSPFSNASHEAAAAKAAALETSRKRRRAQQQVAKRATVNPTTRAALLQRGQHTQSVPQHQRNSVGRALRAVSGSVRASLGAGGDGADNNGILSRFFNARESSSTSTGGRGGGGNVSVTGGGLHTNEASSSSTNNTATAGTGGTTPSMHRHQQQQHQYQPSSSLRITSNNPNTLEVASMNNSIVEMETSSNASLAGLHQAVTKQVSFAEEEEEEEKRKQTPKKLVASSPPTIASALAFAMCSPAAMLAAVSNNTSEEVVLFSASSATPLSPRTENTQQTLSTPNKRQLTMATSTSDLAALLREEDEKDEQVKNSNQKPMTSASLQVNPFQYQPSITKKSADIWLKPSPTTSNPPTTKKSFAGNVYLVEEEETSFLCSSPPTLVYHSPTAAGRARRKLAQQKSSTHALTSPSPPPPIATDFRYSNKVSAEQPQRHEIEVVYVPNSKDIITTNNKSLAVSPQTLAGSGVGNTHQQQQQQQHGNSVFACDKFAFEVEL